MSVKRGSFLKCQYLLLFVCVIIALKGRWPAFYKPKHPLEELTAALDPNHTHFILVDNGTRHKYGGEIDLRTKLEAHISTKKAVEGESRKLFLVC